MEVKELVLKSLEQSQRYIDKALDGLTKAEFKWRPGPECNNIAFLFWHIIRVEDMVINTTIQSIEEVYESESWREKLGTPPKVSGGRYTVEQIQTWPTPPQVMLQEYAKAVRQNTIAYLNSISAEQLSEMPRSDRFPGSIGNVLGFMITEIAIHVGHITYLRGIQRGLDK
ncbi:MAG: DinB family protein [Dehalococcoidales bacterium]|nr:DinB family protein [Dehalococcoidales bacterium]